MELMLVPLRLLVVYRTLPLCIVYNVYSYSSIRVDMETQRVTLGVSDISEYPLVWHLYSVSDESTLSLSLYISYCSYRSNIDGHTIRYGIYETSRDVGEPLFVLLGYSGKPLAYPS